MEINQGNEKRVMQCVQEQVVSLFRNLKLGMEESWAHPKPKHTAQKPDLTHPASCKRNEPPPPPRGFPSYYEMDGWMKKRRELGLALLKFVMESSVLGLSDGELGILPVSVQFHLQRWLRAPFFPPLRTQTGGRADFLRYYHTTARRRRRRGEGREAKRVVRRSWM